VALNVDIRYNERSQLLQVSRSTFIGKHGLVTSIFVHTRPLFLAIGHVYPPLLRRIYPYNCDALLSSRSLHKIGETYRIRSACLVRLPNRWEEKIIVLLPLSWRSRSKRSCSAVGSKLAEGSSKSKRPKLSAETTERMKVLDLNNKRMLCSDR
jgi:hypothetical protein